MDWRGMGQKKVGCGTAVLLLALGGFGACTVCSGIVANNSGDQMSVAPRAAAPPSTETAAKAAGDLKLMRDAGLLKRWDPTNRQAFIDAAVWAGVRYELKRDVVATLSKAMKVETGYKRVEVRDHLTGKVLAKRTALTGAIEIEEQ